MKNDSNNPHKGLLIALLIIVLWFGGLLFLMSHSVNYYNPLIYLFILLQAHLYTGLFITAHDAMHGLVSPNKKLNYIVGSLCAGLFMFNSYKILFPKHHLHHQYVATAQDPDYYGGNFISWYIHFIRQYITIWQFLFIAIGFNLLKLFFPLQNLLLFWILPSILSTFQLFYFGTYLPHKGMHSNKHFSGSQRLNHAWAFVSCYFFGYHYEHHDSPSTPWWQLYKKKEASVFIPHNEEL